MMYRKLYTKAQATRAGEWAKAAFAQEHKCIVCELYSFTCVEGVCMTCREGVSDRWGVLNMPIIKGVG